MRSLSLFRVLILVVAMAVQPVAGGWALAHAAAGPLAAGASEHCVKETTTGGAGDAHRDGAHRMCESCLLCGGPPPLLIGEFTSVPPPTRALESAAFPLPDAASVPARFAVASLARGPPGAVTGA